MRPVLFIDKLLNLITMYKLLLWGLLTLAGIAIVFGFVGILPLSGLSLLMSLVILVGVCYIVNRVIGMLLRIPVNAESDYITGLILFFILYPAVGLNEALLLAIAAFVAMISKYALAPGKRHIFNPAAFGVVVLSLAGYGLATWWIGSLVMLPFTLVLGLLVVRKIRRFAMLGAFLVSSFVATAVYMALYLKLPGEVLSTIQQNIFSYPLIFFGTIMLTEPLTTPPRRYMQVLYGPLVGILFSIPYTYAIGPVVLYGAPELALVIGNIFSYILSFKRRLILTLVSKREIARDIFEFVFMPNKKFAFVAGQYLEWTLGHGGDSRGNRRFFSIASAPTENDVKMGVKFVPQSSSYKKKLLVLEPGQRIFAGQLAGDFILPKDSTQKIVMIAGGIGITPFRSMIKEMIDKGVKREAVLFYSCKTADEIAYKEIFAEAERVCGIKTVYVLTDKEKALADWQGEVGFIDEQIIRTHVPGFVNYIYFLSGPNAMVVAYTKVLREMGVKRTSIRTDYFPGY